MVISSVPTILRGLRPRHVSVLPVVERRAGVTTSANDRSKPATASNPGREDEPTEPAGNSEASAVRTRDRSPSYLDRAADLYTDLTGVNEIARLKSAVSDASSAFDASTGSVLRIREELERRTLDYERLSRRHHDMMQRRHEWGDEEGDGGDAVAEFARLTAEEGRARRARAETRDALVEAEEAMRRRQVEYMDAMRRRYHEEQVWQDKWRVLGTYGTWVLIGLNSAVFLGGQYLHFKREEDRLGAIATVINERTEKLMLSLTEQVDGDVEHMKEDTSMQYSEEGIFETTGKPEAEINAQTTSQSKSSGKTQAPSSQNTDGILSSQKEPDLSGDLSETAKSAKGESENFARGTSGRTLSWAKKSKLGSVTSQLHWPSAAAGAVAASVAIIAISSLSRR